jgi:hypothetical protein
LLVLILGLVTTLILAMVATLWASPAGLYPDWGGGALLNMILAGATGLGAAGIVSLVLVVNKAVPPSLAYGLLVAAPLVGAAVAAGSSAAFGIAKGLWLNRIVQTLVGGSCGLATFGIALLVNDMQHKWMLPYSWLWIVFASYGVAAAFAWIDSDSDRLAIAPRLAAATALLITFIYTGFSGALLLPFTMPPARELGVISDGHLEVVGQVPAVLSFTVADSSQVTVTPNESLTDYDMFLVYPTGDRHALSYNMYVYAQTFSLPAGNYEIRVAGRKTFNDMSAAGAHIARQMSWSHFKARVTRSSFTEFTSLTFHFRITHNR